MKKANIGMLIGIALIGVLGLSFLAMGGLSNSMSNYSTFENAKKTGDEIHVAGKWVNQDQSSYNSERDQFSFYLQDSTNHIELVVYNDPMPVNLKSADKVVVQGKFQDDVFVADKIYMKCPSKYNTTEITDTGAGAESAGSTNSKP